LLERSDARERVRLARVPNDAVARVESAPRCDLSREILVVVTAETLRIVYFWRSRHVAIIAVGWVVECLVAGRERTR
jgi:hypothetical protein